MRAKRRGLNGVVVNITDWLIKDDFPPSLYVTLTVPQGLLATPVEQQVYQTFSLISLRYARVFQATNITTFNIYYIKDKTIFS